MFLEAGSPVVGPEVHGREGLAIPFLEEKPYLLPSNAVSPRLSLVLPITMCAHT